MSFAEVLLVPFLAGPALPLDDVDLAGRGLSFLDAELCESDRAFPPFVDDADSLLDRKVLRSPAILLVTRAKLSEVPSDVEIR